MWCLPSEPVAETRSLPRLNAMMTHASPQSDVPSTARPVCLIDRLIPTGYDGGRAYGGWARRCRTVCQNAMQRMWILRLERGVGLRWRCLTRVLGVLWRGLKGRRNCRDLCFYLPDFDPSLPFQALSVSPGVPLDRELNLKTRLLCLLTAPVLVGRLSRANRYQRRTEPVKLVLSAFLALGPCKSSLPPEHSRQHLQPRQPSSSSSSPRQQVNRRAVDGISK